MDNIQDPKYTPGAILVTNLMVPAFIKVTSTGGTPVRLNISMIVRYESFDGKTYVSLRGENVFSVKETPEQIDALIEQAAGR